jgi:hypothetical protein
LCSLENFGHGSFHVSNNFVLLSSYFYFQDWNLIKGNFINSNPFQRLICPQYSPCFFFLETDHYFEFSFVQNQIYHHLEFHLFMHFTFQNANLWLFFFPMTSIYIKVFLKQNAFQLCFGQVLTLWTARS